MPATDTALEESTLRHSARRALAALDLTSLGEDDTPEQIEALCASVAGCGGLPAAVCVYPEHIVTARRALAACGLDAVRVATVVNLPDGGTDPERAARETRRAVAAGADEVDALLPWRAFVAGDREPARRVLAACRDACGGRLLKVILETGGLAAPGRIRAASELALEADADFIKTSTGKIPQGASLEAAEVMLQAIRDRGGRAGLKVSGGVRTVAEAAAYLALADRLLGPDWASPEHFRIGASALLADIRRLLGGGAASASSGY